MCIRDRDMLDYLMPRLAREAGATEALKAADPMKWVGLMNNCKARAEEIVMHELIYPFAAFITNLGKYNEGALVGEWVKFPTTAEELKKVFERIGIGAKDDFGQTYRSFCR